MSKGIRSNPDTNGVIRHDAEASGPPPAARRLAVRPKGEGIIDHHILHIHHVVERPGHLVWDLVFLGSGVLLIALGGWLIHAGRHDRGVRGASTV